MTGASQSLNLRQTVARLSLPESNKTAARRAVLLNVSSNFENHPADRPYKASQTFLIGVQYAEAYVSSVRHKKSQHSSSCNIARWN